MKSIIRKKRSSSFCMCFGSVVLDNGLMVGEGSERSEGVEPVVSPAVIISSDVKDKVVVGTFGRKNNKLCLRSFSRYVKAVFFETSMMKKMRNKKLGEKLDRTCTNVNNSKPKSQSINNIPLVKNKTFCEDNHSTRSVFTKMNSSSSSSTSTAAASRCSSSSLSWNSGSLEKNVQGKVGKGNGKGCYDLNVGISLLLVSLLVLVIWGKVCAIFCTSTSLFFVYQWSATELVLPANIAVDHHFPEIDTELYKKKIIMEGLLERNHGRNRFPN